MPRVVAVREPTPVIVDIATRVFGSNLRMHLIRYFTEHPGPQKGAVVALGVTQRSVSAHTIELVDAGVVIEDPADDGRSRTYRVNQARVEELLAALRDFATGETVEP